jgi:hypothetical protein
MVIKHTSSFNCKPSKIYPILDFWFENKPSGNPGVVPFPVIHNVWKKSQRSQKKCLTAEKTQTGGQTGSKFVLFLRIDFKSRSEILRLYWKYYLPCRERTHICKFHKLPTNVIYLLWIWNDPNRFLKLTTLIRIYIGKFILQPFDLVARQ